MAAAEQRVRTPASNIVLGLNCGGSDSFSGITANPALGFCSDLLAELGATPVLAETPEIFGAEHLLVRRARNRAGGGKTARDDRKLQEVPGPLRRQLRRQPLARETRRADSPTSSKNRWARWPRRGTSPLIDVFDYAERIDSPGFVFMNTPGYDPVSLAGLAAGGVQPDRLHHRPRQRHRLPDHSRCSRSPATATPSAACATTWTSTPAASPTATKPSTTSAAKFSTPLLAGRLRRAHLRRAPRPQRVRPLAHRAGAVGLLAWILSESYPKGSDAHALTKEGLWR